MKKNNSPKLVLVVVVLISLFTVTTANAQSWFHDHTKGIYSVGVGGTDGIYVGQNGFGGGTITTPGASINVAGEYKVHDYVSVGWQSGVNIFPFLGATTIEIPFIAKAHFHILEVTSVSIKDKLDVYAGLEVGGGPAFLATGGGNGSSVYGIVHVGPKVGARYWFSDKVGVFLEAGWGATFINGGVSF